MLQKKITKIKRKNNKKVHVYIDDEYSFTCSEDDIEYLNLYIDKVVDSNEIRSIKDYIYKKKTLNYLYNLLSKRNYTENQLRKKLQEKHIPETIINELIEYLKDKDILDEGKYFKELLRSLMAKNKYSIQEIKKKLFTRGFKKEYLDSIDNYVYEDYTYKTLKSLIEKSKRNRELTIRYCMRKGFSYDSIIDIMEKLEKEE